jgi:hypothetical protein
MKSFNMRAALEARPIEDQDLEDTAKPAPDAGQIDGDTTTLSGMAKPGQNPVPDTENVATEGTEKIDTRPVDLDDVVLIEQDRRAFQPESTGSAEHDAINAQNIAQEGWISKKFENVKDFFMNREKEFEDGHTATKENLEAIARLRTKLQVRAGEVTRDADTISISKYAKWLSIDGKHITDPARLIRELHRVYELVQWSGNLDKAWLEGYKFVADQIWKLGETDLKKANENLKKMWEVARPQGVEKWLTVNKPTQFKGKEYIDKHSPFFLGQWCVFEISQEEDNHAPGGIIEIQRMKSMKAIGGGEFPALTKAQMKEVLDICEKIEAHLASMTFDGRIIDRYLDALDEFAYRYRNFKSLPREDQTLASRLYAWGQLIMQYDTTFLPTAFSNHLVKVMLSYVEKSMRRIEVDQ